MHRDRLVAVVPEHVAANKASPPDVLEALAIVYDSDYGGDRLDVLLSLASNLASPPEVLSHLAKHHDIAIRIAVARNLNTPSHVLDDLARDADPHVRRRVAENPSTSAATLAGLANDPDEYVRRCVARVWPTALPDEMAENRPPLSVMLGPLPVGWADVDVLDNFPLWLQHRWWTEVAHIASSVKAMTPENVAAALAEHVSSYPPLRQDATRTGIHAESSDYPPDIE